MLRLFALAIVGLLAVMAPDSASAQHVSSAASGGSTGPERPIVHRELPPAVSAATQPGAPCDPDTVEDTCPGTFQLVYGALATAAPKDDGKQKEKAGFAFNVYLTHRTFVELDNDNIVLVRSATDQSTFHGVGDTVIYAGYDVWSERAATDKTSGRPAISVNYGLKLATATTAGGIGSGAKDHSFQVSIAKTVGRTYMEVDAGDVLLGRSDRSGFDQGPYVTWFINHKLDATGGRKLHAEIGCDFATSAADYDMYTLDYLELGMSKGWSFRAGGKFGLTSNMPRAGVYVGLKYSDMLRFNGKKKT